MAWWRRVNNVNAKMKTGALELIAEELWVFNDCLPLPIQLNEAAMADEDLRLTYRYLTPQACPAEILILRHKIVRR